MDHFDYQFRIREQPWKTCHEFVQKHFDQLIEHLNVIPNILMREEEPWSDQHPARQYLSNFERDYQLLKDSQQFEIEKARRLASDAKMLERHADAEYIIREILELTESKAVRDLAEVVVLTNQGEYLQANKLLDQMLSLELRLEDRIKAIGNRGAILARLADFDKAAENFAESLSMAIEHQFDDLLLLNLRNLGQSLLDFGEPQIARTYLRVALQFAEHQLNVPEIATCLVGLGQSYLKEHDELARKLLQKAIEQDQIMGRSHNLARTYTLMTSIFRARVSTDQFETYSLKALESYEFIDQHDRMVPVIVDRGIYYQELKRFEKAGECLEQARQLITDHNLSNQFPDIYFYLGKLEYDQAQIEKARTWFHNYAEQAEIIGDESHIDCANQWLRYIDET